MREIELPVPSPEAQSASRALVARIAQRVRDAGGWIGFDAYMQAALYEPGLGYYSGGSRKFGAEGDFVTAPETGPLFADCLARQCAQWFDHGLPHRVYEFGAGSGALAARLSSALGELGVHDLEYVIVELSAELQGRQRAAIAAASPSALPRVRWLRQWPDTMEGVVLGNELLDAMPVRLFRLLEGRVLERGVALDAAGGPQWAERAADPRFEQQVREVLAPCVAAAGGEWPADYAGELGEQACAWAAEAARRLARGAMLLIDYGFPRAEYYHPQRSQGTLMCHYRHFAHGDPFFWPGLQDITAHVDFSAVAQAALAAGLAPLGYTSQANLLLALGILEHASRIPTDDRVAYARQSQALLGLISEAEMGELFKAIAVGRGVPDDALGFSRSDRWGAL